MSSLLVIKFGYVYSKCGINKNCWQIEINFCVFSYAIVLGNTENKRISLSEKSILPVRSYLKRNFHLKLTLYPLNTMVMIEKTMQYIPLCVCFIDYVKAFDRISDLISIWYDCWARVNRQVQVVWDWQRIQTTLQLYVEVPLQYLCKFFY